MKWINEKTVQGEPNDGNLTEVGKAIMLANSIVHCKDCKYKVETEDGEWNPEDIVCDYWASDGLEADDFCSKGVKK